MRRKLNRLRIDRDMYHKHKHDHVEVKVGEKKYKGTLQDIVNLIYSVLIFRGNKNG